MIKGGIITQKNNNRARCRDCLFYDTDGKRGICRNSQEYLEDIGRNAGSFGCGSIRIAEEPDMLDDFINRWARVNGVD